MNYLISHPHSGNTWLRYCLEFLTGCPTQGHNVCPISNRKGNFLNIDLSASPVAIKRHEIIEDEIKNTDTVLLIVRHPTNCIKEDNDVKLESLMLLELLSFYEKFIGKKKIVYYKDLFDYETIEKTMFFLGLEMLTTEPPSFYLDEYKVNKIKQSCSFGNRKENLKNKWEFHLRNSLSVYRNAVGQTGCDINEIPEELLNNEIIKQCSVG